MKKINSTGFSSCRQLPAGQDQLLNDPAVISIRVQGGLDLIRFLLEQGRDVSIKVSGNSMKPILYSGDTVQLTSLGDTAPRLGELIFFCDSQGNPLLHRLIRRYCYKGDIWLQAKGDACLGFDEVVPLCQVLGRVRQIICHSDAEPKKIKNLESPFMRLSALIIVSSSRIFYYLRRVKTAFKKES